MKTIIDNTATLVNTNNEAKAEAEAESEDIPDVRVQALPAAGQGEEVLHA